MKVYDCHLETLVNSLNQLQRAVKTVPHRQTIIFNIDEGHELAEGVSMACLLSVFADVKIKAKAPHLAVLTSTTSKLSTLAPKAAEEIPSSSGRWCPLDSRQLIQPWSYFGVNLDVEERSEFPTASVARTYDYQIRIGRPLSGLSCCWRGWTDLFQQVVRIFSPSWTQ